MAKDILGLYHKLTEKVAKPGAVATGSTKKIEIYRTSNIFEVIDGSIGGDTVSSVTVRCPQGACDWMKHGVSIIFKLHAHSITSVAIEAPIREKGYYHSRSQDLSTVVELIQLAADRCNSLTTLKLTNFSDITVAVPALMKLNTSALQYLDFSGSCVTREFSNLEAVKLLKTFIIGCPSLKYVNFHGTSGLESVAYDVALANQSLGVGTDTSLHTSLEPISDMRATSYVRKLGESLKDSLKVNDVSPIVMKYMGALSNEFLLSKIDLTPNRDLEGNVTAPAAPSTFDAAVTAELAGDVAVVVDH